MIRECRYVESAKDICVMAGGEVVQYLLENLPIDTGPCTYMASKLEHNSPADNAPRAVLVVMVVHIHCRSIGDPIDLHNTHSRTVSSQSPF
jgi:hypothetical protein